MLFAGNTLWVAGSAGKVAYVIAAEPLPEVDGIYRKVSFADSLCFRSPQFSFIPQEGLIQLCQQFGREPLT